jgi:hypothetical protein
MPIAAAKMALRFNVSSFISFTCGYNVRFLFAGKTAPAPLSRPTRMRINDRIRSQQEAKGKWCRSPFSPKRVPAAGRERVNTLSGGNQMLGTGRHLLLSKVSMMIKLSEINHDFDGLIEKIRYSGQKYAVRVSVLLARSRLCPIHCICLKLTRAA